MSGSRKPRHVAAAPGAMSSSRKSDSRIGASAARHLSGSGRGRQRAAAGRSGPRGGFHSILTPGSYAASADKVPCGHLLLLHPLLNRRPDRELQDGHFFLRLMTHCRHSWFYAILARRSQTPNIIPIRLATIGERASLPGGERSCTRPPRPLPAPAVAVFSVNLRSRQWNGTSTRFRAARGRFHPPTR